jgi:hydrogenase nickel incorporation protein HypA/HybF
MHELTIAKNIISIVENELKTRNYQKNVKKVVFSAGKMNAIIPESLKFGFDVLKKNSPFLTQSELEITEIPIKIKCNNCDREMDISEPMFICDKCGSIDIEILSGKDMFVESIELEEECNNQVAKN